MVSFLRPRCDYELLTPRRDCLRLRRRDRDGGRCAPWPCTWASNTTPAHIQMLDAGGFRECDNSDILGQRLDYPRCEGLDGFGKMPEDDVGGIQRLSVGRLQGIGVRRGCSRYEQRRHAHALHDLRNQSMYRLDRDRDVQVGGYCALIGGGDGHRQGGGNLKSTVRARSGWVITRGAPDDGSAMDTITSAQLQT